MSTTSTAAADLRAAALAQLQSAKLPDRNSGEAWRKVPLSGFDLAPFIERATAAAAADESQLSIGELPQGWQRFTLQQALAHNELAALIAPIIEREAAQHTALPKLSATSAETIAGIGDESYGDFFYTMNLAAAPFEEVLYLPAGDLSSDQSGGMPLRIRHRLLEGGRLLNHRVLIVLAPAAAGAIVEEFIGRKSDELTLWTPVTRIVATEGSRLHYLSWRNHRDNEYHFARTLIDQGADTTIHLSRIEAGGVVGKSFTRVRVLGKGASFRGIGLGIGAGREYNEAEMAVEHHASHSSSSLLYRTVQQDRSHSVFTGHLVIDKGLRSVDSYQLNNNLLLSKNARAESQPRLVIEAEDVSCEHGATMGELDEEALFFLLARGLPETEARALLVDGFISSLIEEIPIETIHSEIRADIERRITQ